MRAAGACCGVLNGLLDEHKKVEGVSEQFAEIPIFYSAILCESACASAAATCVGAAGLREGPMITQCIYRRPCLRCFVDSADGVKALHKDTRFGWLRVQKSCVKRGRAWWLVGNL